MTVDTRCSHARDVLKDELVRMLSIGSVALKKVAGFVAEKSYLFQSSIFGFDLDASSLSTGN